MLISPAPVAAPSRSSETVLTLQALRGVAALLVVYVHSVGYQQDYVPGWSYQANFRHLDGFGAVGVDLFFIISGIVMALTTPRFVGRNASFRFAAKRIARIVPIYWLLTAATVAFLAIARGPHLYGPIIPASFAFIPIFVRGVYLYPPVRQGWSLSFEMFFYLCIFIALLSRGPQLAVPSVAWMLSALIVLGLLLRPRASALGIVCNPICFEFVLGCCIGTLYKRQRCDWPLPFAISYVAIGLIGLLATLLLGYGDIGEASYIMSGKSGLHRLIIWGFPSAALVAGLVFSENRLKNHLPGLLLLIGNASYSIYLIQEMALGVFERLWRALRLGHPDVVIVIAGAFAAACGLAFFVSSRGR